MHYISIEKQADENRNNKKLKRINKPWALNYRWVRPIRLFKSPLDFCSLLSLSVCAVFVRTCTPMSTLLLKQFSLFIFIVFLLPLALLLQSSFGVIWLCNCNRANTIIRWKQRLVFVIDVWNDDDFISEEFLLLIHWLIAKLHSTEENLQRFEHFINSFSSD